MHPIINDSAMPFGSIFHKFEHIHAITADGTRVSFKNRNLTKFVFKIVGIPHIQLRLRSKKIMNNIPANPSKILDAGFGTGVYSLTLENRAKVIVGIDLDKQKVNFINKQAKFSNVHFEEMDITNLGFSNSSFDLVLCSDVLEHIQNDELAFSEIARVLKSGGTLILTVPFLSNRNEGVHRRFRHERVGYTTKDIFKLCVNNGLTIEKVEFYSHRLSDVLSNISSQILYNKCALTLLFCISYPLVLLTESLPIRGSPSGIFYLIRK
jgi:ubiquinone/menaquinone biosynthesis C-methylase UbiE